MGLEVLVISIVAYIEHLQIYCAPIILSRAIRLQKKRRCGSKGEATRILISWVEKQQKAKEAKKVNQLENCVVERFHTLLDLKEAPATPVKKKKPATQGHRRAMQLQ